ncbi:hypothetical protein GALL_14770 [mine drainage metagenome]|uniref:Peptidase M50 domain-containing protein n=1 Tax=mine drainage metagenome TaxID=410659 RepID=A0A1J5U1J1_9ZZZZ
MDMKNESRRSCWWVGALFIVAMLPMHARGEGYSIDESETGWEKFALGFVSGIVAHEAGHVFVATTKGYSVSHDGLSLVYPGAKLTPAAQLQLASAGFQTQWALSEFVLRERNGDEHIKPPGDFGAGVVCSYLGVSFAYLTFLKNQYQGDVYGMSQASGYSRDRISLMLAVPAVLDTWRLFGNDVPKWVPALSVMSKGIGAAWIWSY